MRTRNEIVTKLQGRYGYDTWKVDDFAATDIRLLAVAGTPAAATIWWRAPHGGRTHRESWC